MKKMILKSEKGSAMVFELVVLAIVLAATGYAFYNYYQHKNAPSTGPSPVPHIASKSASPTPSASVDPTAGWLTYKSTYEGMSFKYPSSWKLAVTTTQAPPWTDDDTVTVTGPSGFVVTLFAHVFGIGGGCGAGDCPYVQTLSVTPMPHLSGYYFVTRELRDSNNKTVQSRDIGVVAITDKSNPYDTIPTVGTAQGFPYYLVFSSRGVDKTLASLTGNYPNGSSQLQLSTTSYFALPDVVTGGEIIQSATY